MRKMVLAVVVVTGLSAGCPRIEASAEADLLQQAINYVFTGTTDPKEGPEIADRKSCIVVIRDPRFPRFIRYYFGRFRPDNTRIGKKYAGVRTLYELDVESDSIIIEYLSLDKAAVTQGFRSAQIPLPGNIDQTEKALKIIAEHCKYEQPKTPF